jgi:hypothetical protein
MRRLAPFALLVLLAGMASAQDPSKHDSTDPAVCKTCKPAFDRAVQFVRSNFRNADVAGHAFAGLLFLMLNPKDTDLQACVQSATRSIGTRTGGNSNWYIAISAYFLSEVYLRTREASVQGALVNAINTAANTMEQTGGWGHSPGFWRSNNYHKKGGSRDLGMVTSMMYAAMINMKSGGIDIPEALLRRVEKHLESISDGQGFNYGSDNKVPDSAMGRGSYVFLGLTNARMDNHPFYSKLIEGLKKRYKNVDQGHACASLHHYGVAAAMHRLGEYATFSGHWLDKLIAAQKKNGSISLGCDRGDSHADETANAAVFAIILLLQKEGAFKAEGNKVEWKPAPAGPGKSNGSPFSQKEEKK